ncbi:MAG: PepSY-associated TM helix domain-containing protein [Polyangiales bacterium]
MSLLSRHTLERWWSVHTWTGVVGGLVLHVMFFMGGLTIFYKQLNAWEEPVAQLPRAERSLEDDLNAGIAMLGGAPEDLWLYPPTTLRTATKVGYHVPGTHAFESLWVHPQTGAGIASREVLSGFFYDLHYLWHNVTGEMVSYGAGFLGLCFLLALVSGVAIQLKNLRGQLHQFRPDRGERVLFSDLHKVLGVLGLPLQLTYAFTGAFMVLAPLTAPFFTATAHGGDYARTARLVWEEPEDEMPAGPVAAVLPLDALIASAQAASPELVANSYRFRHHGRANGWMEMAGTLRGTPFSEGRVRVAERDGRVLDVRGPGLDGAALTAQRFLFAVHWGEYGGLPLRLVIFVLALCTCLTILTGNWVWLARRAREHDTVLHRALHRLTVGIGAGVITATAALFLVSRLLPLTWAGRGRIEELLFIGVLGACVATSLGARNVRALWSKLLGLAGALLLPVPLVAARISDAGLFGAGPHRAVAVGVEAGILLAAAALTAVALLLHRQRAPRPTPPRSARAPAASIAEAADA